MSRFIVIGEDGGLAHAAHHETSDRFALYPHPPGCAGWRLWQMMDCSRSEYIHAFERRNLMRWAPRWIAAEAREKADAMRPGLAGREVLFLGRKVEAAFLRGMKRPYLRPQDHLPATSGSFRAYTVPHPSGRNLWYNDPDNQLRAREFLADFARRAAAEWHAVPATIA